MWTFDATPTKVLQEKYVFSEEQGRTIAVDSRGILEALRKVYDAGALADELTAAK